MFPNVSFNFATAISKFDTFSSYHIILTRIAKVSNFFPFCAFGISMLQKRNLPYFIIPYLFTPSFFPFGALRTDRRTNFFTPCYIPKFFFFPPSVRGPTRRRNSTGLAELWGEWPIEQVTKVTAIYCQKPFNLEGVDFNVDSLDVINLRSVKSELLIETIK
jgi:hypothetical protein